MTARLETNVFATFLYQKLIGDSTLMGLLGGQRVYEDVAPQTGATLPFIVYSLSSNTDIKTLNGRQVMNSMSYLVKVVGEGASFGPSDAIAAQINQVLHRARGTVSVSGNGIGSVLSCVRREIVRYTEPADGRLYRHVGGIYEVSAQSA